MLSLCGYCKSNIPREFIQKIELPVVYLNAWSNNFGRYHIIPGYPFILPFLYGFYVFRFVYLLDKLTPRMEEKKIAPVGLVFAFIYIPSQIVLSALIAVLIPL